MFTISIIIPCYNVSKYIDRCINSLINQTIGFENLQIILVDDASTDNTPERLKYYENLYPQQISLILCERNGRQGTARNIGLQYAVAPYIGFVDSDDWIEPDMFELLYTKITNFNCDIVTCKVFRDDTRKNIPRNNANRTDTLISIESNIDREVLIVSEILGSGIYNKLYKKELIFNNNITFAENLTYEDIYFNSLLYMYVNKIYILDEYLYHYYVNNESTTLQLDKPHHTDIFTVYELRLQEFERRGLLSQYPLAMEYNFIKTYYLGGMKALLSRYSNPSYELFLKIKKRVFEVAPNYRNNPHLKNAFSEIFELLLDLLDCDISKAEFEQIAKMFKQIAGNKV